MNGTTNTHPGPQKHLTNRNRSYLPEALASRPREVGLTPRSVSLDVSTATPKAC